MAYNQDDLDYAKQQVAERGESVRAVARRMGIPRSTLHDHISGKSKVAGKGRSTALTYEEERRIVSAIQFADAVNKGLDRTDIRYMVKDYLDSVPER
jgi:transposase-like protein